MQMRLPIRRVVIFAGITMLLACGSSVDAVTATSADQQAATQISSDSTTLPNATAVATPASPEFSDDRVLEFKDRTNLIVLSNVTVAQALRSFVVRLNASPEQVGEIRDRIEATRRSLESVREEFELIDAPAGFEQVRRNLLDALRFHIEAAAALLPDPETGGPDIPRFQELMEKAGEHTHAASSELIE